MNAMFRIPCLLVLALGLIGGALPIAAQTATYPARPGERDFLLDEAELITPEHETQLKQVCDKLLTEKAVPILVVTIPSLAHYEATNWRIERYAGNLFDEWGVGHKEWNYGILLLISEGDRKARIQLGAEWGGGKHAQSQEIMDTLIIPQFKKGEFSEGILEGVKGLDAMARNLELPKPKRPFWHYLLWAGFIGLAIFTIVSLVRRGASGWAWLFWAALFGIGGYLLMTALRSSSSGGGFGGGSFGGGFSGGGGATGSW